MPFSLHNLPGSGPRPGPRETIALLAGLMALNAFAIDAMIPALPAIGADLNVLNDNDRHPDQWKWARMQSTDGSPWVPIPRDRDKVLVSYEGVLLKVARIAKPELVTRASTARTPINILFTWESDSAE